MDDRELDARLTELSEGIKYIIQILEETEPQDEEEEYEFAKPTIKRKQEND